MINKTKLEKIKKLADTMYHAAQYLTIDASRLHKAMDEYHKFIIHECNEEPVSEKKCMFAKDNYTDEDRMVLCENCKEKCEYSKKEETVSEDLENIAKEHSFIGGADDIEEYARYDIEKYNSFKAGAQWQKEKDSILPIELGDYINELSKQFPEVSFAKLSRIAVRVAKWQKEQMMTKAVDGKICETYVRSELKAVTTSNLSRLDYKVGDKVKIIVIKEY